MENCENRLKLVKINQLEKNKIKYEYEVMGDWKKVFNIDMQFFIKYNFDITDIPESIKVIPFLSNVLPIAWVYNAIVEIDSIDKKFYAGLTDIIEGYRDMYPMLTFNQNLEVKTVEDNKYENIEKKAMLFSGGVDSFSTFISHKNEKPSLITMWGSDISLDDKESWEKVKKATDAIAKENNVESYYIKSNFRTFINTKKIDEDIKEKAQDNWWHGFQHGMGLLGQTSILAYKNKINTIYIASSHTIKDKGITCASDPKIDNKIKFASCKISHDQYDLTRQDKVNLIIDNYKNQENKPLLRVCWQSNSLGENCSECEKCYRTIYGIIAAGGNPIEYGFKYNKKINRKIKNAIKYKIKLSVGQIPLWKEIKAEFENKAKVFANNKAYKWIYKTDFDKIEENKFRKIRKAIGRALRKVGIKK